MLAGVTASTDFVLELVIDFVFVVPIDFVVAAPDDEALRRKTRRRPSGSSCHSDPACRVLHEYAARRRSQRGV